MVVYKWTPGEVDDLGFYDFLVACDVAKQWLESEHERMAGMFGAG